MSSLKSRIQRLERQLRTDATAEDEQLRRLEEARLRLAAYREAEASQKTEEAA